MSSNIKILLTHPTSNEVNRATALGFHHYQILSEFHTSIAVFPKDILYHISNFAPFTELKRRIFDSTLKPYAQMWPWYELGRIGANKAGLHHLIHHEKGIFSIDGVYKNFDLKVAKHLKKSSKQGITAVYAYEDGAYASFVESKRLGLQCFYDLPIGYWRTARKLLQKERDQWPEWSSTLTGFLDSDAKLARKDEELRLADRIFVASQFTAKTLFDYPGKLGAIDIIPYGFPPVAKNLTFTNSNRDRPLKLLFVGGLSQRKGIANLFSAVEPLAPYVKLTVVGRKASNDCPALDAALKKHNWIPSLSHADILKIMQVHDVLVFPSLFEGFGLVISEAMSQGLPVITTDRTAGPDLIDHDENGWIIEAGSTSAIQMAIEQLITRPDLIRKAGKAAIETARNRTWEVFGRELAMAITNEKQPSQSEKIIEINAGH